MYIYYEADIIHKIKIDISTQYDIYPIDQRLGVDLPVTIRTRAHVSRCYVCIYV